MKVFSFVSRQWLVTALFSIISYVALAQWTPLNTGATYSQYDIQVLDDQHIFVAGIDGLIKSADGGQTWSILPLKDQNNFPLLGSSLLALHFFDENTGVATGFMFTGNNEIILRTTDGGEHWSIVHNALAGFPPYSLDDFNFPSPTTGYVCGNRGVILKTTDAGLTWQHIEPGASQGQLYSVYFRDANHGFVFGEVQNYKTDDGGDTWTQPNLPGGYAVHFPNQQVGYALGSDGLYSSTDGGNTWQLKAAVPANAALVDLYFSDVNTGYLLGGEGRVFKTTNGGDIWEQSRLNGGGCRKFDFQLAPKGWILGNQGKVWKTLNAGGVYAPIAGFSIDNNNNCAGFAHQFTNATALAPNYSYQWWLNGSPVSTDYHTSITFPDPGQNYEVMLVVSNGVATDTMRQQFQTQPLGQFPTGELIAQDHVCAFQGVGLHYDTVLPGYIYQLWRNDSLVIPAWYDVWGQPLFSTQPTNDDPVTFVITADFFDGCIHTLFADTVHIVPVQGASTVQITLDKPQLCPGDETLIRVGSTQVGNTYSLEGPIPPQPAQPGNGGELVFATGAVPEWISKYTLYVSNPTAGCYSSRDIPMYVHAPQAHTAAQYHGLVNEAIQLEDFSAFQVEWDWQFGPQASPVASDLPTPTVTFSEPGYYPIQLVVTAGGGCKDTVTSQIDVFAPADWDDDNGEFCLEQQLSIPEFGWYFYHRVTDAQVDPQGNTYIVGRRTDTLVTHSINEVGFVQKRNAAGQLLWEQYFIPNYPDEWDTGNTARCHVVEIDPNTGNVWVAGEVTSNYFKAGNFTFDGLGGWIHSFLAKLSPDGEVLWVNVLFNEDWGFADEVRGPSDLIYAGPGRLYMMQHGPGGVMTRSGGLPTQNWGAPGWVNGSSWFIQFDEAGNLVENHPLGTSGYCLAHWGGEQQLPAYRVGPRMKLTPQGNLLFYGIAVRRAVIGDFAIETTDGSEAIVTPFVAVWDTMLRHWVTAFPVCSVMIGEGYLTDWDKSIFGPGFAADADGNIIVAFSQPNYYAGGAVVLPDGTLVPGLHHSFMFKFSPTGELTWLNINRTQQVVGLEVLADGRIAQVSNIRDFAGYQQQNGPASALPARGSLDWIISMWSPDGDLEYARNFGADTFDQAYLLRSQGCGRFLVMHSINTPDDLGLTAQPRLSIFSPDGDCSGTPTGCVVGNHDLLSPLPLSISLYPNPTSGDLSIEWLDAGFKGQLIQITNTLGQVLFTQSISTDATHLDMDMSDLQSGLYFLQVVSNGKVLATEKFVKQ